MQIRFGSNHSGLELDSLLGEGLNSRVYRAFKCNGPKLPKQTLAAKLFNSPSDVREFESRFLELSRIRSKYFPALLGWQYLDQQVALIMDYVDGVRLDMLADSKLFTNELRAEVSAQIVNGIRELHELGIAHGDLSPENVMVDKTGQIKILDYGFGQVNASEKLIGTPKYLAPERWAGKSVNVKSDLFSLGLLLQDLKDGTLNDSLCTKDARLRAELISKLNVCASLNEKPELRTFPQIENESPARRNELAKLCLSLMKKSPLIRLNRTLAMTRTLKQANHFNRTISAILTASFALLISPTTSGCLGLAKLKNVGPLDGGSLQIRTQEWNEIELNGELLGYTPIDTVNLAPGTYALRWRSATKQGVRLVRIEKRNTTVLNDLNLTSVNVKPY